MTFDKDVFYQSKYDYYKLINKWVVILSCLAEIAFWVADCQLFNRLSYETLLPRTFILLPMLLFIIVEKKVKSYKIMVKLSYLVIHAAMWCTIWAVVYMPDKQYASEGFVIMHLMFLAVGFCAPKVWSVCFHSLLLVNILASNLFNHYENLDIMIALAIPCLVGICAAQVIMEKSYMDQFIARNKLEEALVYDQLTRVYNRNELLHICLPGTNELLFGKAGILMLDIDHFKEVNDVHGHYGGDAVLMQMTECIKEMIRSADYIIRWGGEEFLIILPEADLQKSMETAENIRLEIQNRQSEICNITVSIGVTDYNGGDYHVAVSQADDALYYAKEQGRNRVSSYEELVNL